MIQVARWVTLWTLIAVLACALLAEVASATAGPPPEAIQEAQRLLARLGYAPGPANGMWDRRSIQAYQAFFARPGPSGFEHIDAEGIERHAPIGGAPRSGFIASGAPPEADVQ